MAELAAVAETGALTREGSGVLLQWWAGFFFAFRLCTTYLAFQGNPQAGSVVVVGLGGCVFAAALLHAMGAGSLSLRGLWASRTLRWLALYLALTGASVIWTGADSSAAAGVYWLSMAIDVGTAALLVGGGQAADQADGIMRGFAVGSMVVAVVAWCSPTLPDLRIGNEDFLHPNGLGLEFALAFFFAQHLATKDKRWRWVAVALGVSLLRTISKTSIIATLVAEAFYVLRGSQISRRAKVGIAVGVIATIAVFWGLLESYFVAYSTTADQAETLTGRTSIWAMALLMGVERPWFGHGLYSFRALIPAFGDFQPWHAHNELIQQFFEFGLAGVAVTLGLYLSLMRSARRCMSGPFGRLALVMTIFALVHGLTDTVNFGLSLPLWCFVMLIVAMMQDGRETEAAL